MQSRDLERYRLFRSDTEPGVGVVIPEDEPVPTDLCGPRWVPVGQTTLPRVTAGGCDKPEDSGRAAGEEGRLSPRPIKRIPE